MDVSHHTPDGGAALRLDPEGALATALGRVPGDEELSLWASMPTERRAKTLARIAILRRWVNEPGEMTAAEAAREADVAVSRWYEIAAAWKASPVLASVGTFAKRPGRKGQRLDGAAVNRIQSILPKVVSSSENLTVAAVVNRITSDPELTGKTLPHVNTLRAMVQRERLRQKAELQVGSRPGCDAVACELLRSDGSPHVLFAVVDRTSRLILGFTVGRLEESRAAYARAASDALARITAGRGPTLPWADETTRMDVIVGADADVWSGTRARYEDKPVGPVLGLITEGRRFGRYLRLVAGDAIGQLRIYPNRTEKGPRETSELYYSDDDALTAIEVEVTRHNAEVIARITATGAARPAPTTILMLEFLVNS